MFAASSGQTVFTRVIGAALSQSKATGWPPSGASVLAPIQLSISENRNSAQLGLAQGRCFPQPCDRMLGGVAGRPPQLISPLGQLQVGAAHHGDASAHCSGCVAAEPVPAAAGLPLEWPGPSVLLAENSPGVARFWKGTATATGPDRARGDPGRTEQFSAHNPRERQLSLHPSVQLQMRLLLPHSQDLLRAAPGGGQARAASAQAGW